MLFLFPVVLVTSAEQRTHFAVVSCSVWANIPMRERLMHFDFLLVFACLRAGDAAREEELLANSVFRVKTNKIHGLQCNDCYNKSNGVEASRDDLVTQDKNKMVEQCQC